MLAVQSRTQTRADTMFILLCTPTGNGQASKEQVADMLKRILKLNDDMTGPFLDATDALAAAYCHYLQMDRPVTTKAYSSWKDFINKNPNKVIK